MNFKKLLSGILSVSLCFSAFALDIPISGVNTAFAEETDYTEYTDNQGIVYHVYSDHALVYDTKDKTIKTANIPSYVNGVPVTAIECGGPDENWYYFSPFLNCTSLTAITIPETVNLIDQNNIFETGHNSAMIFSADVNDLTSLVSINVDPNNKYFSSEDGVLFNKNKSELLAYPCGKKESSYSVPDSVTYIGMYAFNGCPYLTNVSIPASVTVIGDDALLCKNLKDVYYSGSVKKWKHIECLANTIGYVFGNEDEDGNTLTPLVHCSDITIKDDPFPKEIYGIDIIPYQSDPNCDGEIDSNDATMILIDYANNLLNGSSTLDWHDADTNGDWRVDSTDATNILIYYANKLLEN